MGKLLFAGSRTDCVTTLSGSVYGTTSFINNTYSDAGIAGSGTAEGMLTDPASAPLLEPYTVAAGHSFYFHAQFGYTDGYGGGSVMLVLVDSAQGHWVQLLANGQLQYNAGTAGAPNWQNLGTPYGTPGGYNSPNAIDIKLEIHAGGNHTVMLAYGGVAVVGPIVFNQPLLTGIQAFQITGQDFRTASTWSQLLCTEDLSTIGGFVKTVRATGAGAHSAWSGAYTDVNEVITDNATYNQALTSGLEQSYPMANIAVPAGCIIQGVFTYIVAKNDGSNPANISSLIRTGDGTDHMSANLGGLNIAYIGVGARYDINPETGVAWTQADWNAVPVQLGFVSEA